ncbi:hypothetical protein T07_6403 [Trichinella nelsoni]|uniref:Uncharacterized protein n=1 Tax=Trichinella nelsoni TaxID=6336 RepID=A0A0V0SFY4_9BILA|nr:hypothetical protein T07_6403 [Trichinella nelsoni]
MSRETPIASLQRLASLLCVKSFGQCHISQTSTITLEWRFQYLLSLNHNILALVYHNGKFWTGGVRLTSIELLAKVQLRKTLLHHKIDNDAISLLLALSVGKAAYKAELICWAKTGRKQNVECRN